MLFSVAKLTFFSNISNKMKEKRKKCHFLSIFVNYVL